MNFTWQVTVFCLGLFLMLAALPNAKAGNGIASVATGSRSLALGGSNQATQDDAFAVFANPAALVNIRAARLDIDQAGSYAKTVRHSDRLNPGRDTGRSLIPFGNFGAAKPVFDGNGTMAIAFAGIGGAGAFFEDLDTGLGTRDRVQGAFGIFQLAPGISYEVQPGINIGASVGLTVSRLDQDVFPDTSVANAFYGYKLTGATAIAPGMRVGATWKASENLTLGAVYVPKTKIDFKNGKLISNQSSLGSGKVQYNRAESFGTNLPEEFGLSGTLGVHERWNFSARTAWLRWSRAIGQTRFFASDPVGATSIPVLSNALNQNWRDQVVLAFGIEYAAAPDLQLRLGYNYGRNPIPKIVTSPLNNAVTEHHLSGGFGWSIGRGRSIDAVAAWLPQGNVSYNSPYSSIGNEARIKVEFVYIGIQTSLTW